jgi:hypothetical protein
MAERLRHVCPIESVLRTPQRFSSVLGGIVVFAPSQREKPLSGDPVFPNRITILTQQIRRRYKGYLGGVNVLFIQEIE